MTRHWRRRVPLAALALWAAAPAAAKRKAPPDPLRDAARLEASGKTAEAAALLAGFAERNPDALAGWRARRALIRLHYARAEFAAVRHARAFCASAQAFLAGASRDELADAAATCETFGHYEAAAGVAKSLVQREPRESRWLAVLGRLYYALGRFNDAEQFLFRALELPSDGQPYLHLYLAYREDGRRSEAARAYETGAQWWREAIAGHPEQAWFHAWLAQLMAEAGRELEEALRLAQRAHSLDAECACHVGLVLSKLGRYAEAAPYFASPVGPKACMIESSRVAEKLGQTEEAERILRALLSWNPRDRFARTALDELLARIAPYRAAMEAAARAVGTGDFKEALRRAKKARKLAKTDAERAAAFALAGRAHLAANERDKARESFRRAFAADPAPARLSELLASGPDKRTAKLLDEAEAKAANDPAMLLAAAWGRLALKLDEAKGLELLERAIASGAGSDAAAQGLLLLAEYRLERKEHDQALRAAARSAKGFERTGYYPQALALAGRAHELAGRSEKAAGLYRLACKHLDLIGGEANEERLALIAVGCEITGGEEAASRIWQGLAARHPEDTAILERLAFLHRLRGDLQAARAAALEVARASATVASQLQLAFIHAELGEGEACAQAVARGRALGEGILRRDPRDAKTLNDLAALLARFGGEPALALELAQRIPDGGGACPFALGLARLAAREPRKAAEAFEACVRQRPFDAIARLQLGLAYLEAGALGKAKATWDSAAKLDPENRLLRLALEWKPMPWARGCGTPIPKAAAPAARAPAPAREPLGVPRVAVLPMDNETNDLDGPETIRPIFHDRLERRGYRVQPLAETDRLLREKLGLTEGGQLRSVSPKRLGEALGVDALVYGTLHEFGMMNVGFAANQQVKMSQRLVDAGSGEPRWEKTTEIVTGAVATSAKEAQARFVGGWAARLVELATGKPVPAESLAAVSEAMRSLPRGSY